MFALLVAFLFAICSAERRSVTSQEQSGGCSICQLVVSYVESYLQQNATEQEIVQKLDVLCAKIPVFGQECDSLVSSEVPNIIKWIENKENPQAFCSSIKLCAAPIVATVKVGGPIPCSICQVIVTYVEKWVSENATEEAIVQRLDVFCGNLGPLSPECDSFVAIYVPRLITWIVTKENPQKFCAQVHLCNSKKLSATQNKLSGRTQNKLSERTQNRLNRVHTAIKRTESDSQQSGGCQICQVVVTYVEQLVAQNKTVAEIVKKVDELCSFTPPPLNQVCDTIAAKYVPSLVKWILKKENPQAFCAQVKLC